MLDSIKNLSGSGLQNVHAPMPMGAHLAFCIIATVVYLIQFKRKKSKYYFYLTLAVDLTLLTQFYEQWYVIAAVAIAEIILLVMSFFSYREEKKLKKIAEDRKKELELMEQGEQDGQYINKYLKRAQVRRPESIASVEKEEKAQTEEKSEE